MNIELQKRYESLITPSADLIADISMLEGDIIVLGAGGKMGPALCILAKTAIQEAGINKKVIAVSRFREEGIQQALDSNDIITINADLLNDTDMQGLPEGANVIYMAGMKFGSSGNAPLTWAMNTYLPGRVAEKYRKARIVVFSTGNVYPLLPVATAGATESNSPAPVGEYAQSCLGRERIFSYFSSVYGNPTLLFRLNYANDATYGVLHEIASSVRQGLPVDLNMGHFNAIWQSDANEIAIRSLHHCGNPPKILNVTGPETVSVRWCANEFGKIFGRNPVFTGEEQPTALLSNSAECSRIFGYPKVSLGSMIEFLADWISAGGKKLNKPTHFQERKGNF
jgi:nucleoside-diphosphate-sugar epimerase